MKEKLQEIIQSFQGEFSYDEPRGPVIADLTEMVSFVLDVIIEEIKKHKIPYPNHEAFLHEKAIDRTVDGIVDELTQAKEQLLNANEN